MRRIKDQRNQRAGILPEDAPRGTIERVAESLDPPVSHSLVSRVNIGMATSGRVREALEAKAAELRRMRKRKSNAA